MNVQLSSRSDEWHTPKDIIERVHRVLGSISLDPASSASANCTVQAERYIDRETNGLKAIWGFADTIFLNPPGGKLGNRSMAQLFWDRLIHQFDMHGCNAAVFMGFSLEQLQTTQRSALSILDFPFCVPRKRIRFVGHDGSKQSPSHSNVIALVGGDRDVEDRFQVEFQSMGKVVWPWPR